MTSTRFGGPAPLGLRLAGARTPTSPVLATADALRLERRLRPLFQGLPAHSGVAVAVIQGDQRTVACRGYTDPAAQRPVRADSRFEIGSITKTFTALLLAEMVARGEVGYDDPIDRYLPAGSAPGYPKERPITLLHLATHTSGLPRLPVGLLPSATPHWFTRPCATFSAAHLLRSLARTPVRGTPGTQVRYSSLGCGLLGLLLENAAGARYEDLLESRVCAPLGLLDTSCAPGGEVGSGYRRGRRIPSFRIPALPGAAGLRSSADDMLRYVQALLVMDGGSQVAAGSALIGQSAGSVGPVGSVGSVGLADGLDLVRPVEQPLPRADSTLRYALSEVRRPRAARRLAGTRVCLGWKQRLLEPATGSTSRARSAAARCGRESDRCRPGQGGEAVLFHEGVTRGFVAFAGFNPQAGTGLVALVSAPPPRRRRFLQTAYETLRGLSTEQQGP
ncbi:serine hydrolase domain-containing protein [Kitasatospora kifunensis]|uniref:CubicO group peptidase (Beta-lactamase class C family) n=1 Tax=Kitasatospora kifunensis TaxID=58351 RepID=A0A7W7R433_KITKI|nr:serine hydrolase domain-containing protein [Kitasatospora kifunensis]MBB4924818.1 CubicO group peptidase (beta-lactamase class C family) [Kitasatospora kifunensis]